MTIKLLTVHLFLLSTVSINAWTTTSHLSRASIVKLEMASKAAKKIASRSKWAEKRGITDGDSSGLCTIIGSGRIGSLLEQGGESLVLKRGDSISSENEGTPILIATRNDSLDAIIEECPENRLKDLVFLQNGYLDKFLSEKGLSSNTQSLLYLSVPSLGAEAVDGITSVNPDGLTAATGVHAQALADRLESLGLKCNVVTEEEYKPAMFEKLIWISTYMLVGKAKECSSVGQAGKDHAELVETVVNELVAAVSTKENITFAKGTMERLAAYTDVVADFPCGVKEFEWRNEYFYNLGDEACATHNALLKECKEKEFIDFDLP